MLSVLDRYKDRLDVENLYDIIEMLIEFNNIKNSKEEVPIEELKKFKKFFKQIKTIIFKEDLNIEMIAIKIYDDCFNGKLSKQKITPTGKSLLACCAKLSLYVNRVRESENYNYTTNDEFYIKQMKELMGLLLSQKTNDTSNKILNYAEKCLTEVTTPLTETKEVMAAKKEIHEDFTEFIDIIAQETNEIFKPSEEQISQFKVFLKKEIIQKILTNDYHLDSSKVIFNYPMGIRRENNKYYFNSRPTSFVLEALTKSNITPKGRVYESPYKKDYSVKFLFVSTNVEKYLKNEYLLIEDGTKTNQFESNNIVKVNVKKNKTNL